MGTYVGLDVSQALTSICVVDADGRTIFEGKAQTCPEALAEALRRHAPDAVHVGMETGPLAVWLWNGLRVRGVPIVCLDARHASAGLSMMTNKTDRNDAAGLAQIVRTGWYRPVHVKSQRSHLVRALLAARDELVKMRGDVDNQIRGLRKTFGIVFGRPAGGLVRKVRETLADDLGGMRELADIVRILLRTRADLRNRVAALHKLAMALARGDKTARRLMTAPGVGVIIALSIQSAIDDPARFRKSSSVGAYLGLVPRRYASGEVDRIGRISKHGDRMARTHLFEAANVILTRPGAWSALKAWGLRIAKRAGFKKAKVAVARRLAAILHRMWINRETFRWTAAPAAA